MAQRATKIDWSRLPLDTDSSKRSQLIEVPRYYGSIRAEELYEAGDITIVDYGQFEVLTEHGLRLLVADLGMEGALELMMRNADRRNEPSLLETPLELLETVTRCAGLIIRPKSWQRDKMVHWVSQNGPYLMHYFGEGVHLATLPEYEIRSLSLVHSA